MGKEGDELRGPKEIILTCGKKLELKTEYWEIGVEKYF